MTPDTQSQNALPIGWEWRRLDECCVPKLVKGEQGATPYLEIGDINIESKRYLHSDKPAVKGALVAEEGDVLISRVRPTRGAITLLHESKSHVSSALSVLTPRDGILSLYIFYYLAWNKEFSKHLGENCTGTMYPTVSKDFVHAYPVPVTPLDQQKRIVAEIEKQFSRLDEAVANLKRVKANLKRYKAAVLKAAVEGRLIETEAELTRKKTPSPLAGEGGGEGASYETGEQLLQRILETRRSQWQGKGKYKEPAAPDTTDLPELPEGWVWALIGQAFDVYVGATPSRAKPEYWGGGVPWVSSGEVAFCRIKSTRESISREGLDKSSTNLHPPGTVLLGMIGEGKTRGQVAILDIEACNNQNSAAIRVAETDVIPEYMYSFLEKEYEETRRRGSGGNQPALNKERVKQIPFSLPPVAEQRRIVAELDRRLSLIRETETQVDANLQRADRLRQSILRQAFTGSLVGVSHANPEAHSSGVVAIR